MQRNQLVGRVTEPGRAQESTRHEMRATAPIRRLLGFEPYKIKIIDEGALFEACVTDNYGRGEDAMQDWLRTACEPSIMRRAFKYAIVVGAVLIAINHGDALLRGDLDAVRAQ